MTFSRKPHADLVKAGTIATAVVTGSNTTAVVTGSNTTAVEVSGVPMRTVQRWMQEYREGTLSRPGMEAQVAELIEEEQLVAQANMVVMVRRGVEVLGKVVDHWLEHADELTPNQMKDLALVIGIITDKAQVLAGRPTSTTMRYSVSRTEHYTDNPLIIAPPPSTAA